MRANECRWELYGLVSIRVRFEFEFEFEFDLVLVLVLTRSSDQESESEFEGSWVDMVGAGFWGREGEKRGKMSMGLMVG